MEGKKFLIPIEIIPRHIHLSEKHWRQLFGLFIEPRILQNLSQREQMVLMETVKIIGPNKNFLEEVHAVGGWRRQTQVEISESEAVCLGLHPPVRLSGNLIRSPGCKMVGPKGSVIIKQGVIIPVSHLHLGVKDAEKLKLKQNQVLSLGLAGRRDQWLDNVVVRVHPSFRLALHITSDVAAKFWLSASDKAFLK